MNKEQTHREINKLITQYKKRASTCSSQWDKLSESDEHDLDKLEVINESQNNLITEIDLMREFIEDLNSLLED